MNIFRIILGLSILFQIVFSGTALLAADDVEAEASCSPKCREGFFCKDGECVSPCNPACPALEVCSRNGKCIPEALPSPPPQAAGVSAPAPSASAGTSVGRPAGVATSPPARYPYSTGIGNRVAGTILLLVGVLNLATAPLCTTDMVDSSLEDTCLIGSLAFGGTLTLIGIPLLAVGNAKKRRYLEWRRHTGVSGQFSVAVNRQYGGLFWSQSF